MTNTARTYYLPPTLQDQWTTAWGEDRYGIWSEVTIAEVVQRFRWIEPGSFTMGSPKDEPERRDNEQQHEVELTKGFWLADTACTQQLWLATMGEAETREHPPELKRDELPMDSVSWEDCDRFFEKANQEMPELNLRFPTEAEWEYACRAGTKTPFSFGANITPAQVNYNGNHPYNNAEKGGYRGRTVSVKEDGFSPNDWGLYQMHGNVFEWCSDWYGEYPSGQAVNPKGPEKGEFRVLRGGSWSSSGRWCRSARRDGFLPGARGDFFGFRLARGQVELR